MESIISFKERILSGIITGALPYSFLVGKRIIVRSPSFKVRSEYALRFFPRNYLHLTGVLTALSSMNFYSKALDGSLSRSDFDRDSTPALKDTVRCKACDLGRYLHARLHGGFFLGSEHPFEQGQDQGNEADRRL